MRKGLKLDVLLADTFLKSFDEGLPLKHLDELIELREVSVEAKLKKSLQK